MVLLLGGAGTRKLGSQLEGGGVEPIESLAELGPALRRLAPV
ncbi:MAG TPA: hypothetical protein VF046_08435 [Gemmatimonadales bacterium]